MTARLYRDGAGTCATCKGSCDIRAKTCRSCMENKPRRRCPECLQTLPRAEFEDAGGRRRPYCKPCMADWHRNHKFVTKYGITATTYDAMLAAQGGGCAICGAKPASPWGRSALHVDHDHATGKVRGLLCMPCNTALGFFRDSPSLLARATTYLYEHEGIMSPELGDQLP
jgi:hypothetical protein